MDEDEKNGGLIESDPEAEPSPSEKLDGKNPDSARIPGAQRPDNQAIKGEINPNTE
ncbi:MAG: hypothetical protein QOD75_512 [Blastocatellia bacterium]|jgi:hypothetical protein|nr:hypothetical protein [Blastocatellia bacterium]